MKIPKPSTYTPAAWQWDPAQLTTERVQYWSAGGSMSMITLDAARLLVTHRAAFVGSAQHICQVHEGIAR